MCIKKLVRNRVKPEFTLVFLTSLKDILNYKRYIKLGIYQNTCLITFFQYACIFYSIQKNDVGDEELAKSHLKVYLFWLCIIIMVNWYFFFSMRKEGVGLLRYHGISYFPLMVLLGKTLGKTVFHLLPMKSEIA